MKICKLLVAFLAILLFLGSCGDQLLNDEFKGGDWFYLENDGAVMPVWVRGNTSSNVFVVFLHGGPGYTSMDVPVSTAFKELHTEYAFVYFDQRGSGSAQGNARPESFTVEQFVEDLQKLVYLIRHKYNNPTLFLMGHSWGGTLGTAYLLEADNQRYISGWVEIDGGHNSVDGTIHSWEWAVDRANEKIASGVDATYWQNEIKWYANTAPLHKFPNPLERHVKNIQRLNGYYYNSSNESELILFASPLSPFSLLINNNNVLGNVNFETLNLSPEMHKIKTPSLVLWGRHDGILPVIMAYDAFDNLGTDNADKYLHIFEYSAHNPMFEEPEDFVVKVKEFIEKYK